MAYDKESPNHALAKGFELLALLGGSDEPLGLAQIAERTGRPKQTLHRVLGQLEDLGLVTREPIGARYRPGASLIGLSRDVLGGSFRVFPRHLILQQLVDRVGESCNIGILDQASVLYLDRVECEWPLRWHLKPGSRVPLHSTSLGKLLLAGLPPPERRRLMARLKLERFTERTITDPGRLEEECRQIAAQGYATNNQESHAGLISVAVAIPLAPGRSLAGLSIHAPLVRLGLGAAREHVALLHSTATRLAEDWRAALGSDRENFSGKA